VSRSQFSARQDRLCALLIQARHAHNLTQTEVAKRLRRPQSFVSKYERGERRLDVLEFVDVVRAIRADACTILKELE
jgi:transcriptional regulator with XRE-family HTH domain